MKNYIFAVLTFCCIHTYAQKGFYVRPVLEHKFNSNSGTSFNIITPQNYILKVEPINFYAQKGLDIGFYLGYRTKNFFFETGWSQDKGSQAVRVSGLTYYAADSTFYQTELTYTSGISFNKIPVKVGVKLFGVDSIPNNKNWIWQGFAFVGLDFLSRQSGTIKGEQNFNFITNKNSDTLKYNAQLGGQAKSSYMSTIGVMFKATNKKGLTLNLSVHYSQGSALSYTSFTGLTFTNHDGTVYKSFVGSRSSGLYFSISTDIYPVQLFKKPYVGEGLEIDDLVGPEIKTVN